MWQLYGEAIAMFCLVPLNLGFYVQFLCEVCIIEVDQIAMLRKLNSFVLLCHKDIQLLK